MELSWKKNAFKYCTYKDLAFPHFHICITLHYGLNIYHIFLFPDLLCFISILLSPLHFFPADRQRTVGKVSSAIGVKAATLAILYETDHRPNNPFTLSLVSRFCPGTRLFLEATESSEVFRSHVVIYVNLKSFYSPNNVSASGCRPMSWGFPLFLSCFLLLNGVFKSCGKWKKVQKRHVLLLKATTS